MNDIPHHYLIYIFLFVWKMCEDRFADRRANTVDIRFAESSH